MFFYSELMNLYTPVEVVSGMPLLSQENNLLLMGSCFASEMGQRLADAKFCCDISEKERPAVRPFTDEME